MKNISKYFMIIFGLVIGMFMLDATKANAYALYYNSSSPLGVKYDTNGKVTDVADTVIVYGQNVNSGYTIANSESLRVTDVKVTVGSSTQSISSSYYSISTMKPSTVDAGYKYTANKTTDKFEFKMQKILNSYFSNYTTSNDITITISLEKKKVIVFVPTWESYTSISYKDSSNTATSGLKYVRTNSALLKSSLATSTGKLYAESSLSSGEKYYSRANSTTSGYYYQIKTPFKLASGSNAKLTYKKTTDSTSKTTTSTDLSHYSTYSVANILSSSFSGMFKNNVYDKYAFESFSITAVDIYGIQETVSVNPTDEYLTIATKTPTITSIDLSSDNPNATGAIKVKTKYDLSGLDFDNNTYSVTLTSIEFNVGSDSFVVDDGSSYANNEIKNSKTIQREYTIFSSEGTGTISFKKFSATVTDKYGNTKTYTNNSSISHTQTAMTLIANAEGSKFDAELLHYYNGEYIKFELELNMLTNSTVSGVALVDEVGNTYQIYSTLITKTSTSSVQGFSLTSSRIDNTNSITWVKVRLLGVCYDGNCDNYDIDNLLYFNQFKAISSSDQVVNDNYFNINGVDTEAATFTYTSFSVANYGSANVAVTGCSLITSDANYGRCSYSNTGSDGYATISIPRGAIRLGNGQKNEEMALNVVSNTNNPTPTITPAPVNSDGTDTANQVYYDNSIQSYFYTGTKQIEVTLNDGYCGAGDLYYRFNSGTYSKITFSCTGNVLNNSSVNIVLPSADDNYTLDFYITTDGLSNSEYTSQYKYVARNELDLDEATIVINGDDFFQTKQDDYFNAINVGINGVNSLSLLNKYRIQFAEDLAYTETTLSVGNNLFRYDATNRLDLANLNGEEVSFTVTLIDKLGNSEEYEYTVIIDTTTPDSPDPLLSGTAGNYLITISNYNSYTNGDTITISYGAENEAYCVKGENAACSFIINSDVYSLQAIDKAGNTHGVTAYTTTESKLQLTNSNLVVYPFLDDVYSINGDVTVKIFKYEYTVGEIPSYTTITRGCTNVTTYNCYSTYKLNKTNMYDYIANELAIKLSSFNLQNNYTYLFIVTLGNASTPLLDESGAHPRLNMEYKDVVGPELVANSVTGNPVVISDSTSSNNTFTFNFTVTDTNLDSGSTFEYLIINKANAAGLTLSNDKFKDYLSYCPRNLSSYANACGQWSTAPIVYTSVNGNSASGVITVSKDGRMLNNTSYLLFVKVYDASGNYNIVVLNEFINIAHSVDVYYKDGDAGVKTLATDNTIKTVNANANLIIESKTLLTSDVNVQSIKLNGNEISSTYRVGQGIHTLVITDTLGNVETIIIYCGALSRPEIKVYNLYNGTYYEISSDSSYAYNSSTLTNLYVKIVATNLQDFAVNDGNGDTVYDSHDEEYIFITNADDSHEHGMKLSDLISATTGTVRISATGDGGEVSSIELVVDNEVPTITIMNGLASSSVYLFDSAHSISYDQSTGKYTMAEANYRYELNYEYLFDASKLNLVVDNKPFNVMKEVSNLIIKLDGVRILDYTMPIATLPTGSEVSIEYFDDAGNIAAPLYINLKIVDKEAPVLEGLSETRTVEANTNANIIDESVVASDNFDYLENISIKVKLNSTVLFEGKYAALKEAKHNFNVVGQYTLTFTLTDTTGNTSQTYTQTINAIDTTGPLVTDPFSLTGFALGQSQTINLPRFTDTDVSATVYYPSVIEFYMGEVLVDEKYYSLTIAGNIATIRFNDDAKLGDYIMLLQALDAAGNSTTITTTFVLTDTTPPVINVYVNGVKIDGDSATIVFGDSNYSFTYEGIDAHDGKVTVSKSGPNINVNREDSYVMTLTAKDKSGVQATRTFTINVAPDTEKPVINKLKIGDTMLVPSNSALPIYNQLNYRYEIIELEAKDNSAIKSTEIKYNGVVAGNKTQVRLVNGTSFVIEVTVEDTSGNIATASYYVSVDNTAPKINGLDGSRVYDHGLNISVSDPNLTSVEIYKNNAKLDEYNSNGENYNKDINGIGVYEIIARDSFDNETRYVFEIKEKLTMPIKYNDGSTNDVKNNGTFLVKTELKANEALHIYLPDNALIADEDQVYILVNYPGTNYMKEIYSTNGAYYNKHDSITINGTIVSGESNADTLEIIGGDYYAYVMVVKANTNAVDGDGNGNDGSGMSPALKSTLTTIGIIALIVVIVIIIIKARRKVRAV